jgi:hypothetical protein
MRNNPLFAVFLALFVAGCIKEINFDTPTGDLEQLVVSGNFTNMTSGVHTIRLTRPNEYGVSAFNHIQGAKITLYDEVGNSAAYMEGTFEDYGLAYYLPAEAMPAVEGRSYWVEIITPDGRTIRSEPQKLLEAIRVDSIVPTARKQSRTSLVGVVVDDQIAVLDAVAMLPNVAEDVHLRWDMQCTYVFIEYPVPGQTQKICYVTDYLNEQKSYSGSFSSAVGRTLRQEVGARLIDFAFEYKCYFTLVQRRVDKAAYEYFKHIGSVANPEGTVFDTPPGSVKGNCYYTDNPSERPLGYFEVAAIDTFRVPLRISDFPREYYVYPHCTDGDFIQGSDQECFNCLILPNSSLKKPHYWEF